MDPARSTECGLLQRDESLQRSRTPGPSWQPQCCGFETVREIVPSCHQHCTAVCHPWGCPPGAVQEAPATPGAEHPHPRHIPHGTRRGWGARGQAAARGMSREKMSPPPAPETIKWLNKTLCLSECSLFLSVCLGSGTLTSWPYRGAAERLGLIAQETGALAKCSALEKPGQEFRVFALQKNSSPSFPPFLSAAFNHRPLTRRATPRTPPAPKVPATQINSPCIMFFLVRGLCVPSCPGELM